MTQLAVIEHQQRVQSFRLLASGFANAWPVIADGHRYGPIGPNTQLILMNTSSNVHLAFGDENVVATYDDVYFSPQGGFPGHVNSPLILRVEPGSYISAIGYQTFSQASAFEGFILVTELA